MERETADYQLKQARADRVAFALKQGIQKCAVAYRMLWTEIASRLKSSEEAKGL